MGRLDSMIGQSEASRRCPVPSHVLKSLYMDTVAYEPEPLEWCASLMGAGQLLLGTDHPYGDWSAPTRLLEKASWCSPQERKLIESGNAERLFAPNDT
jgi:aminocarboxymuconate-semialdehyde decarboxylase